MYTFSVEAIIVQLSIKSLSGSEESSGGQQMIPERLSKVFSTKATWYKSTTKNLWYLIFDKERKYVAASVVTDRQIDRHDYHNPCACALRINHDLFLDIICWGWSRGGDGGDEK